MDDDRVWKFEKSLWQASKQRYHDQVDDECVMALSHSPFLFEGQAAIDAVSDTPAWDGVEFTNTHISRPQEGLIIVGYEVKATKAGTVFEAACTSTYRRIEPESWTVVQHSQVARDHGTSDR